MTQSDYQSFADNYTSDDIDRIKFDWNGEHGDNFLDNNYDFRTKLCDYLISQLNSVKLELIRDLYLENANSAKETFGVYNKFHLLGDELLKRGGTTYLMDYLKGSMKTMDTYLASGRLTISKRQSKELVDYIDSKLTEQLSEQDRNLLENVGKRRFEYLANN